MNDHLVVKGWPRIRQNISRHTTLFAKGDISRFIYMLNDSLKDLVHNHILKSGISFTVHVIFIYIWFDFFDCP